MTAEAPIPVNLLTGFLGSGKTTLLQRMLADPAMAGAAVLVNEFGEVGLDHQLLDRIDDTVVLMKSGCLCCTVRGEVADSLADLFSRRARGAIPAFDRVVIESTGLADPFPVLSTIRAHPVLRSHFTVGQVITTVDAVNAAGQIAARDEAVRQIGAADVIALTKTDLCEPAGTAALRRRLAQINPAARVVVGRDAATGEILNDDPARWLGREPEPEPDAAPGDGRRHHHHHHHDDALGVVSFSLVIEDKVDWTAFGIWLTMLLNRHGDRIFRVKGILDVAGEPRPVAVHGVQHLVHPPVHLSRWPSDDRRSRLVFILEGLDPEAIRRSFDVFNRLSNPARAGVPA